MAERLFHIWRQTAVRQIQSDAQRTAAGERQAADNRRRTTASQQQTAENVSRA